MDVYTAIVSRRSIRRFQQKPIAVEVLMKLVDTGRLAPSAANLQPLEYMIVTDVTLCAAVFSTLGWAGYLKPRWTPAVSERPTAYVIILVHKDTGFDPAHDVGLAAENIMLAAEAEAWLEMTKNEGNQAILELLEENIKDQNDHVSNILDKTLKNGSLGIMLFDPEKRCSFPESINVVRMYPFDPCDYLRRHLVKLKLENNRKKSCY